MSDDQITFEINELLVPARGIPGNLNPVDVIAAQFYIAELDRREKRHGDAGRDEIESKRWRIDLKYERGISILIVIEIILAIGLAILGDRRQTTDVKKQLDAFKSMQTTLSHLEDSSKATADTLTAVRDTMSAMRTSMDKQVELFYDVALAVTIDTGNKRLSVSNTGRTNMTFWGIKVGSAAPEIRQEGSVMQPGTGIRLDEFPIYDRVTAQIPKPNEGTLGFEVFIKNARGEEFVQHGNLRVRWQNDTEILAAETTRVVSNHWSQVQKSGGTTLRQVPSINH